jgi:HSP20 family protein
VSNLTRYDPFRGLSSMRDMMDEVFNRSLVSPRWASWADMEGAQFDMRDENDAVVVEASLPGFEDKDVDVQIEGNLLTVSAEKQDDREERNGEKWYLRERRFGRIQRTVQLPVSVDGNKAEAGLSNGVLTIKIPKAKESVGHKITVTGKKLLPGK